MCFFLFMWDFRKSNVDMLKTLLVLEISNNFAKLFKIIRICEYSSL